VATEAILIRVPVDVKRAIEQRARANDRSASAEVRRVVVAAFAPAPKEPVSDAAAER